MVDEQGPQGVEIASTEFAPSEAPHGLARRRIFLAEDDPEMRRLVAEALRKEGHDVFEAANGGQLLVRLARTYRTGLRPDENVDLIVTDLRMPVCNGLDIVSALREASWRTPVIVMTAFSDSAVREQAAKLNAIVLSKPFRIEVLKQTVRETFA